MKSITEISNHIKNIIFYKSGIFFIIILFAVTCKLTAQNNIDSGLVAYYPFNGNAYDESGNGNDGTANGAAITTDRFGNINSAYSFDGVDDFIIVADSPSLCPQAEFSISVWTYPLWPSGINYLIGKGERNYSGHYGLYWYFGTRVTFEICFDDLSSSEVRVAVPAYQYFHIVATYNGSEMKIYINSNLGDTISVAKTLGTNNKELTIGKHNSLNFPYYFNNKIDDIRIYNRALTDCEIAAIYQLGVYPQSYTTESMICENDTTSIAIIASDSLKTYQLQDTTSGLLIGTVVNGNSDTLVLSTGNLISTTAFRIVETDTATGCQRNLSPTHTVTVVPYPATPTISLLGSDSLKCSATAEVYKWFFNGSLLPDSTQIIIASQYGKYQVIAIDHDCESDSSDLFNYTEIGVREIPTNYNIYIYPNPNDGNFILEFQNSSGDALHLTMFNVLGKVIFEKELTGSQINEPISVGSIEKGIYFTEIQIGDDQFVYRNMLVR